MKKMFILLMVCLALAVSPILTFAANYNIPKAAKAPVIDGKINAVEWKGAYKTSLTIKDADDHGFSNSSFTAATAPADLAKANIIYLKWDKKGLYTAFKVTDKTPYYGAKDAASASLNDCVQLVFNPLCKTSNDVADAYVFSLVAKGIGGKGSAFWFENWQYNSNDPKLGIKVKGNVVKNGYNIECFIPWKALNKKNENLSIKPGTKMGFGIILLDYDKTGKMVDCLNGYGKGQNVWTEASFDTITLK